MTFAKAIQLRNDAVVLGLPLKRTFRLKMCVLFRNEGKATYLDAWHRAMRAADPAGRAFWVGMKARPDQAFTSVLHWAPLVTSVEMKL